MKLEELEAKIIDACEKVKEMGYEVKPSVTYVRKEKVCLIGAGMVLSGSVDPFWEDGLKYFCLTSDDANLLASGYDNYTGKSVWMENEFWQLGNKLRERYS